MKRTLSSTANQLLLVVLGAAFFAASQKTTLADIVYSTSGSVYTQDFNSLANSTSTTAIAWLNNSTIQGWHLFQGNNTAITTYLSHNGSVNNGSFYSFGTTSNSDRALGGTASGAAYFGSPASGTVAGFIAVSFLNSSGSTLSDATIGFDGEQWRNGGNTAAQPMVLEYGIGATFAGVTSWTTPGGSFNWSSTVNTATAAAVDGNVAGLNAGRGGVLSSLNWADGSRLWIRWIERNDAGNDHGLAIDNFSFSAISAVPEPSSMVLVGLVVMGTTCIRRRR